MTLSVAVNNIRPIRRPSPGAASPGRRMRVRWPAQLRIGAATVACHVVDVSVPGARLQLDGPLPDEVADFVLILPGFRAIAAVPIWQERDLMGIRFTEENAEIAAWQSRRFDPAAWLNEASAPSPAPAEPRR